MKYQTYPSNFYIPFVQNWPFFAYLIVKIYFDRSNEYICKIFVKYPLATFYIPFSKKSVFFAKKITKIYNGGSNAIY